MSTPETDSPRIPKIAANPIPYWARDGKTKEVFDRAFTDFAEIGFTAVKAIAANPIPYWARAGKTKDVFEEAFADFQRIGFTAVKADVPAGMSATAYRSWKVELGLDRTMISSMAVPARMARPAVGAGFDADRLALAIENCGVVCQVLASEGLRPLHHSHVGGVFETEAEITRLLDELGADVIGVGPDTGHLRWAGVDPAAFIARYADRIGGIHIKDCFPDHLDHTTTDTTARGYRELTATKRVWAEPGLGVVDFDAVLAAMPADYDGDFMIEIDEPSTESRFDSHQLSFDWARRSLPARA